MSLLLVSAPLHTAPQTKQSPQATKDIWEEISNYRGWSIASLSLTGIDSDEAKKIRHGLELDGEEAALYEQNLSRDISRIRLYMTRKGYPYCAIAVNISPLDKNREIDLEIAVEPGPPIIVDRVEMTGVPDGLLEEVEDKVTSKQGIVFSDEELEYSIRSVKGILLRAGHARASISSSVELSSKTKALVRIDAVPGAVYYFDSLRVNGASDDLNKLARQSVNIKRGERFKPKTVNDARDNLSGLGLFSQIRISLENSAVDSLKMVVELNERRHKMIELAGGYWSDDGLSARVRWRNANLFRRGRGLSFEISYTQYKRSGTLTAWWPALFWARLTGTIRLGYNDLNEDSYEKSAPGIGLIFTYAHTRSMSSSIGYVIEKASYEIKTTESEYFEDPKGPVSWLQYRFVRDGTDDRINPARGTYSWIRLEYSPRGGVTNSEHLLAEISGTIHTPIMRTLTFATNLHLGAAKPLEPSVVLLPDKRFYAGGSTSHRGFSRRRLGPLDENGLPLGGEVLSTGFFELRFPLVWKLNGAAFLDWGQIWATRDEVNWRNIEVAVGPAIRIMTPVGPLRFDFGYRLTDYEPSEPEYAFHFAIGFPM